MYIIFWKVIEIKKIKLKFYGLGYYNVNQALVSIYDINNNLIYEDTTYNNELYFCINEYMLYKIVAKSNYETLNTYFYVNDMDEYIFNFNNSIYRRPITFLLTDYYYSNLKIERGEIILWQKQ